MLRRAKSTRDRIARRVFGDERRIGLWILPLFVMAALLGAVLVGGLAALYYGQQVDELEQSTASARRRLDRVVRDVDQAAKDARADIDKQVAQARDEFSRQSPVQAPAEAGIYSISAMHPDGATRVGSAFTVFSNAAETYLVTTYAVVAQGDSGAIKAVEVFLANQSVTAQVHNIDRGNDLAIIVVKGGPFPVSPWRPPDQPVKRGDAIYVVGLAGAGTPTVLEGHVAGVSDRALVPSMPLNAFLAGAPLIDGSGKIVGIASQRYAPFGAVEGTLSYAPPIRTVCEVLIDCTAEDVGAEG